jgi:putative ABC transport system ATP-binding protein
MAAVEQNKTDPVVARLRGVAKQYQRGAEVVPVLEKLDLDLPRGDFVALMGPSGSGKTTLLNLLGGLDRPTSGRIELDGVDLASLGSRVSDVLGGRIASVFQSFGLIGVLSAAENVEVPLRIRKVAPAERRERVAAALAAVGLAEHAEQRPAELSGGQQQRVGLARALVGDPGILLADEPTGQLDSETGATIMQLIAGFVHRRGMAAIVATHDPAMMALADRVVELHDGRLTAAAPAARVAP